MNFAGILGHIVSTTGLVLSFLIFPHHTPAVITQAQITPPVVSPTHTVITFSYTAIEQYTYQGHSAAIIFSIPKSGGEVSGTISGDCSGTVSGIYDGGDNGNIHGTIQATCPVYFFPISVTGTYSGIVHTIDKKVDVNVDVKADGFEKTQQVSLPLH